jgi:hypothetical protein
MKRLTVELKGTRENPYRRLGLQQNPVPQDGATPERAQQCLRMQSLGGDPIPSHCAEVYIRQRLHGWSEEFVQACLRAYRPGEYVRFTVLWPA